MENSKIYRVIVKRFGDFLPDSVYIQDNHIFNDLIAAQDYMENVKKLDEEEKYVRIDRLEECYWNKKHSLSSKKILYKYNPEED